MVYASDYLYLGSYWGKPFMSHEIGDRRTGNCISHSSCIFLMYYNRSFEAQPCALQFPLACFPSVQLCFLAFVYLRRYVMSSMEPSLPPMLVIVNQRVLVVQL